MSEANIFSRDTEQMVIGCMLASITSFKCGFEKNILGIDDFYFPEHREIFLALKAIYNSDSVPDSLLVAEKLKYFGKLEAAGGIKYLVDLSSLPGTSAHFESYFELLKEISSRRSFVSQCDELKKLALTGKKDVFSIASLAADSFSQISHQTHKRKVSCWLLFQKGRADRF